MYTSPQTFKYSTPPAVGTGAGYSLSRSPKFNLLAIDKYGLNVTSRDQYSNQNNLSYSVDVCYPDGTIAPNGLNFSTGIKDSNYVFSYDDNLLAFNGSRKRQYSLTFKLSEASPPTTSSAKFNIYHNEAQISGVSSVLDGTIITGTSRNRTGTVDINLTLANSSYYSISKFQIYTGFSSSFAVVTGTGAGSNMLKEISIFDQKQNYTLTINDGEQPFDHNYYFYKILPYDDFGSGVLYSSPPISGIIYSVVAPSFTVTNITGKNIVLVNDGKYAVETFHYGSITGTGYNIIDVLPNITGNMVLGGLYNADASGDFDQSQTYMFKTIKYMAQTIDASGNVSNREILITDNSTSLIGTSRTGLLHSEYAVSDSSQSAKFLVSGSGYANGTGTICLMSRLTYPSGSYKLLRTIF